MQTKKYPPAAKAQDVGQCISQDEFDYLSRNFKSHFPDRSPFLNISKELLQELLAIPCITGLRFMYGIIDPEKPDTCMVIMPCSDDANRSPKAIPNIIIRKDGYRLHTGEQITLDRTWEILFNYVANEYKHNPQQPIKTIHRGDFWGVNRLQEIVATNGAASFRFNFGYASANEIFTDGFHPVLEPIDKYGQSLKIWLDITQPCPPLCDGDDPGDLCLTTNIVDTVSQGMVETELDVLRDFRDNLWLSPEGQMVEMYYYASPVLTTAINILPNRQQIYIDLYESRLKPCLNSIANKDYGEVKNIYKNVFNEMMNKYLFQ